MNNGKIRIYELSRELNLDNKDLLSICEGLNIAVKSHSSTITESDVERIRMAAEKYADRPVAVKSRDSAALVEGSSGPPSHKLMGRPDNQRKQQIVEIRKPKSRPIFSSPQGGHQLATPPQHPVKPQAPTPRQPTNINRPTRVSPPEQQIEQVTEQEETVSQ